MRKPAPRRVRRNVEPPDRARSDFFDLAKGQATPKILQWRSFHTGSTRCGSSNRLQGLSPSATFRTPTVDALAFPVAALLPHDGVAPYVAYTAESCHSLIGFDRQGPTLCGHSYPRSDDPKAVAPQSVELRTRFEGPSRVRRAPTFRQGGIARGGDGARTERHRACDSMSAATTAPSALSLSKIERQLFAREGTHVRSRPGANATCRAFPSG